MKSSYQNLNSSLPTSTEAWFDSLVSLLTQTIDMKIPQTLSLQTIFNWHSSTVYLTSYSTLEMFPYHILCYSYRSRFYHLSLDYYNSLLIDLLVSSFAHITLIVHFFHFCQSNTYFIYTHIYTYNENLTNPLS